MSDFSKKLRKRLGNQQPKQPNQPQVEIEKEKVSWIIENYAKWIKEIIEVTAEYKAKYGVPEENAPIEIITDYEEECLWLKHHALIDYVKDAFMKEFQCSKEVALKYVFTVLEIMNANEGGD